MTTKVEIDEDRLAELLEKEEWLDALETAGVDNWQGYEEALRIKHKWEAENES